MNIKASDIYNIRKNTSEKYVNNSLYSCSLEVSKLTEELEGTSPTSILFNSNLYFNVLTQQPQEPITESA
jgi:hypothetical protein